MRKPETAKSLVLKCLLLKKDQKLIQLIFFRGSESNATVISLILWDTQLSAIHSWSPAANFPVLCPVPSTMEEPQPACHKHSISVGWMEKLTGMGKTLLVLKGKNKLGLLPFASKIGEKTPRRSSLLLVFLIRTERLRPVLSKGIRVQSSLSSETS